MKLVIIDANPLLRYLVNDISSQAEQTEQIIKQAQQGKIKLVILEVVITEVVFTLEKSYKWKKYLIGKYILKLISAPLLEVEKRNILIEAVNKYITDSLSFIDCLLIVEAKNTGAEIFSFDKKLLKTF